MSAIYVDLLDWSLDRDGEGHRTYTSLHKVETTDYGDGPGTVMETAGLPAIGSFWNFGNEVDFWAICRPNMRVRRYKARKGENHVHWSVELTHSTIPWERCQDTTVEDPLLEPQRVSGSYVREKTVAEVDRNGDRIEASSFDLYPENQRQKDEVRPVVRIQQNVADLQLDLFSEQVNTVNDDVLWGMPARTIKLSELSWERRVLGVCTYYYTRTFDFEINSNTFDLHLRDEGFREVNALKVGANPNNVKDFINILDNVDNMPTSPVPFPLDGNGIFLNPGLPEVFNDFEHYDESDFTLLGIPTTL